MTSHVASSTIAARCGACSSLFHELSSSIHVTSSNSRYREQVSEAIVQDELGRFRVWLANVGAHRSGRVSLDYRLREASHMRQSVLELLDDLEENLSGAVQIVSGQRPPYDESHSDSGSSDSGLDDLPLFNVTATELQETMGDVHDIISSLYEISITIRDPAPRDRLLKIAAIDVSHFERWDTMHVEHKFPLANSTLVKRLACANSKRRQYFKYLEKHHDKLALGAYAHAAYEEPLAPGIEPSELARDKPKERVVEIGPRSIAASTPTTIATKNTQTTVATYREEDKDIFVDDNLSETSSAASEGVSEAVQLYIPAPPKGALDSDPFECPYCFEMMKVSSLLAWRMHVIRDLQPYSCTFPDCTQSHRVFPSRQQWFSHEAQHRQRWSCRYCTSIFSSKSRFSHHLELVHSRLYAPTQLQALIDMCMVPLDKSSFEQCPLCLKEGQHLRSHLARHLRTLALFVLPKATNVDNDDVDSNGVQTGGSEEREDVDARFEALSDSDQMSEVAEDAAVDIPETDPQIPTNINSLSENATVSRIDEADSTDGNLQALRKLRLSQLPAAAKRYSQDWMKPLPDFLQIGNEEIDHKFKQLEDLDRARIQNWDMGPDYQNSLQSQPAVKSRNRNMNVYPWDNNRIRLDVPPGACDYINASPIRLRSSRDGQISNYIATQGPKDASHFWRMVWQETGDTAIVVMLTKTVETGRVSSLQYFPIDQDSSPAEYTDSESTDNFTAVLALKYSYPDAFGSSTARVMKMSVSFESQDQLRVNKSHLDQESVAPISTAVFHCQFEGWADFTTPQGDDQKALIELCKLTRRNELEYNGSPRIVHCGAGSGRTGTFIALDFLLGELDKGAIEDCDADTDMIFNTADSLRKQRMLMVRTPELYHFLYDTLKEELLLRLESEARKDFETWFSSVGPLSVAIYWPRNVDDVCWIDCTLIDGRHNYICRSLENICELRDHLKEEFPDEEVVNEMGSLFDLTDPRVDQYFNSIVRSPPHVFYNISLLRFFEPREGDSEEGFWNFLEDQLLAKQKKDVHVQEEEKRTLKENEEDDALRERMRETLLKAGFSEEAIEKTMTGHGLGGKRITDLIRPTYMKVHRKHMSPDTLDIYEIPWEWDDRNEEYIIIKTWIPDHDQDVLFEHTRKLREAKMLNQKGRAEHREAPVNRKLSSREDYEGAWEKLEIDELFEEEKKDREKKERETLKDLAIKEYSAKALEEEEMKRKKKEEEDKAFRERMSATLIKAGYSEDSIEKTLKGKRDKDR